MSGEKETEKNKMKEGKDGPGKVVNALDHATCGVGASAGSLCNRKQKKLGSSAIAETPFPRTSININMITENDKG